MNEPIKYEYLQTKRNSFWSKTLSSKEFLGNRVLKILLFPIWWFLVLFTSWSDNYMFWVYKVSRLKKSKKFEEAFSFGFEKLTTWSEKDHYLTKGDWPPFQMNWWMTFKEMCDCALELDKVDILEKVWFLFEKKPGDKTGWSVSDGLTRMVRVAWMKEEGEKAWEWANQAVCEDDTYGYSYFLRAWIGEQLGLGQPLADLVSAIKYQPELEKDIFSDDYFLQKPNLLENLKVELSKST
jgi:hypothetical protein